MTPPPRPFAGAASVPVILPSEPGPLGPDGADALAGLALLIRTEPGELAVELGAPVTFPAADPGGGPRFLVGPAACNPALRAAGWVPATRPTLDLDRAQALLVADAPDLAGILETLNLLRTLGMTGATHLESADCRTLDEAVARVVAEVGWTYPAFGLRGLDWAAICARHAAAARRAADPLPALQRWLAELQDAHTWARPDPPPVPLPYSLRLDPPRAVFTRVPPGSAAWAAGVRPGDALVGEDVGGWWARTGAPPHSRPWIAGRRLLATPAGGARRFAARAPDGTSHTWEEVPGAQPAGPLVTWRRLASGTGYLRVAAWRADADVDGAVDAAFRDLAPADRLIVDLRANTGGSLNLARAFRDRFLHERTFLGTVRVSTGDGGLAPPEPLIGEPAALERRWPGPVRFLTDALTFSASEDVLLGLQGLPHVQVVGTPSGGGSGRPRTVRLLPGQALTVSTALTYDRRGHCVEGAGIPVDLPVAEAPPAAGAPDRVLAAADRAW